MLSRRTRFASPFVVVLGCGGPAPASEPAPVQPAPIAGEPYSSAPSPEATHEASEPDAAVAEPLAGDPSPSRPPPPHPCDLPPHPSNPTCNPPRPRAAVTEALARVINVTDAGGGVDVDLYVVDEKNLPDPAHDWDAVFGTAAKPVVLEVTEIRGRRVRARSPEKIQIPWRSAKLVRRTKR